MPYRSPTVETHHSQSDDDTALGDLPLGPAKQHAPTAETEEVQHFDWYHRCSQQHQTHMLLRA
jgi:hypothetical protein